MHEPGPSGPWSEHASFDERGLVLQLLLVVDVVGRAAELGIKPGDKVVWTR